jgi:hypothetical protein
VRRHTKWISVLVLIAVAAVCFGCNQQPSGTTGSNTAAPGSDKLDRTILPIVEPKRQTYKELDARNAKAPERWEVKAPEGAPNVVVVRHYARRRALLC